MEYLRKVDFSPLAAGASQPGLQWLLDRESGAKNCSVVCIKAPPGVRSPAGLHTHPHDQIYYVLSGVMSGEIAGSEFAAGAGTLIVFPADVPHCNWNDGKEEAVVLSFQAPLGEPGAPAAIPVPRSDSPPAA
jgi:quercetin dioxygenase-like cupin family protein